MDSDQEDVKGFGQHRGHLLERGVTSYGPRAMLLGKLFVFSSPTFHDTTPFKNPTSVVDGSSRQNNSPHKDSSFAIS